MSREWTIAGFIAVLLHVVLLFGFRFDSVAVPLAVSETGVEVSFEGAAPGPPTMAALPEPAPAQPMLLPPAAAPAPETPRTVITTTAENAQVAPPTPAPAERAVRQMPPRPAHPSQAMSRTVGATGGGHNGAAPGGANGAGGSPIRTRSNPKPPYPPEAQRLHQQGRVLLEVEVGTDGRAVSVTVKRSSGFPMLDKAAVEAVERWLFEPARVGGMAVVGRADVPVNFALGQ